MSASKARDLPARLEGVRERFARWRHTHRIRSRIPESLWAAAVRAAGVHGLHRTAKALRLNYYALKERVEQQSTAVPNPVEQAATARFLELPHPAPVVPCECTLELEDAGGAKMRVYLKGVGTPDLAALSRSFWNPAS